MKRLIADSGSTKTQWALVEQQPGLPKTIELATTHGLNPLYVSAEQITAAFRDVLHKVGEERPDEVCFYGSGCSGERISMVEQALRRVLTPMTRVTVDSDLMGAALSLTSSSRPTLSASPASASSSASPVIIGILGTGSIAAHFDPLRRQLTPMPALGYILGDEGSGAWFGRHLLGDYLKGQMPDKALDAFEEDFGEITPEQAIRHVYQQPCPNRYLATFAAFLGRHLELSYAQELAFKGIDAFWKRNIMRIGEELDDDVREVRLVGSVAWHLKSIVEQVSEYHGYVVSQVLKDPIEGLV